MKRYLISVCLFFAFPHLMSSQSKVFSFSDSLCDITLILQTGNYFQFYQIINGYKVGEGGSWKKSNDSLILDFPEVVHDPEILFSENSDYHEFIIVKEGINSNNGVFYTTTKSGVISPPNRDSIISIKDEMVEFLTVESQGFYSRKLNLKKIPKGRYLVGLDMNFSEWGFFVYDNKLLMIDEKIKISESITLEKLKEENP